MTWALFVAGTSSDTWNAECMHAGCWKKLINL